MEKQKRLLRRFVTVGAALCAMLTGFMLGQASTVKAESVNKYNSKVTSVGVSGIKKPEKANLQIPDRESHLHGVLEPPSRSFRATFSEF